MNGRWPLTLATWFFALGVFVPDRTFQSGAELHVSVRDVRSGAVVARAVSNAGEVLLSQLERASGWGFVQSIVVPPFWTSSSERRVRREVRSATIDQLCVALARELKSPTVRSRLDNYGTAKIGVAEGAGGLQIRVDSSEALSYLRLRQDLDPVAGSAFADFEKRLMLSRRRVDGRYTYAATFSGPLIGKTLQVLVRTVSASVASRSFRIR